MILNSAGSETKFAGNGDTLHERACCAKKRAEGTGVGKGVPTRDHSVKELKGNDESEEEWDRLQWGSLQGLAEDKRNGMKQRTMGKPICMWSSS